MVPYGNIDWVRSVQHIQKGLSRCSPRAVVDNSQSSSAVGENVTLSQPSLTERIDTMAENIDRIIKKLGAKRLGRLSKMSKIKAGIKGIIQLSETLRTRLKSSPYRRSGRPTDKSWVKRPKVPMSEATFDTLTRLSDEISCERRKVSPMQVAAELLESAAFRQLRKRGTHRRQRKTER